MFFVFVWAEGPHKHKTPLSRMDANYRKWIWANLILAVKNVLSTGFMKFVQFVNNVASGLVFDNRFRPDERIKFQMSCWDSAKQKQGGPAECLGCLAAFHPTGRLGADGATFSF